MKINYINLDGNWAITDEVVDIPVNIIKLDNTYFEKREEEKETKKEKEIVKGVIESDVEERALAYLKWQKVRGAHLWKGQKLIDKAVENGFII